MKSGLVNRGFINQIADVNAYLSSFMLENAIEAVYVYDEDCRIVYVNELALKDSGYSRAELLEMKIMDLDPVFSQPPIKASKSPEFFSDKLSFRAQHKHKTGYLYPVDISLVALDYEDKVYNAFFAREISMLVEAEESLGLGEESFRVIADTSPVALIISRVSDGQLQYANRQAFDLFRQSTRELTDGNILDLFKRYSKDNSVLSILSAGHDVKNHEIYFQENNKPAMWLSLSTKTLVLDRQKSHLQCLA